MPLANGSEFGSGFGCSSGSCYFRHWPSRSQQKTKIKSFSACYFLKVHLHNFLKIKSQKEVTKRYESRFFLLSLLTDRRNRIRIQKAQKHTSPTDPDSDPQHCWKHYIEHFYVTNSQCICLKIRVAAAILHAESLNCMQPRLWLLTVLRIHIRDPGQVHFWTLDPDPGFRIGFFQIADLGSLVPDLQPIFLRAWNNFVGKLILC